MKIFSRHYLEGNTEETCYKVGFLFLPSTLTATISRSRGGGQGMESRDALVGGRSQTSFPLHFPPPAVGFPWQESNPIGKRGHFPACGEQPLSPSDQLISRGVPCVPWGPGAGAKSTFPIERFCLIFPGAGSKSQALNADLFCLAWRVKKQD